MRGRGGSCSRTLGLPRNRCRLQEFTVTEKACVGIQHKIVISGTMRAGGETITRVVPAIPIRIGTAQE